MPFAGLFVKAHDMLVYYRSRELRFRNWDSELFTTYHLSGVGVLLYCRQCTNGGREVRPVVSELPSVGRARRLTAVRDNTSAGRHA